MAGLTTHVLDTAAGKPAAGMKVELSSVDEWGWKLLKSVVTGADGRTEPLLSDDAFKVGQFGLVFHVADYFRAQGVQLPDPPFLNRVHVRFGIADAKQHYLVPLICSPWSYSVYRGS